MVTIDAEKFVEGVISVYDSVFEFMEVNQIDLAELFETGATTVSLNGQQYELAINIQKL